MRKWRHREDKYPAGVTQITCLLQGSCLWSGFVGEGSITSCLLVGLGSPPPPLLGPQEMDPSLFARSFLTPHPKHTHLQIQHLEGK